MVTKKVSCLYLLLFGGNCCSGCQIESVTSHGHWPPWSPDCIETQREVPWIGSDNEVVTVSVGWLSWVRGDWKGIHLGKEWEASKDVFPNIHGTSCCGLSTDPCSL